MEQFTHIIPGGHLCAGRVLCASLAVLLTSPSRPTRQVPGLTFLEEREWLHEAESISDSGWTQRAGGSGGRAVTAGARQRVARTRQQDMEWAMTGTTAMAGRETAAEQGRVGLESGAS